MKKGGKRILDKNSENSCLGKEIKMGVGKCVISHDVSTMHH